MATKRRVSIKRGSSQRLGQSAGISSKKAKKGMLKAAPTRTRTSIVGTTIYLPDIKPTAIGRKLLEALER